MHAIQAKTTGGPEVLEWVELDDPTPGEGQLCVDLAAAGLNFIDTYHRSGLYKLPLPSGLGMEAAAVVEAAGPAVSDVAVGDRLCREKAYGG